MSKEMHEINLYLPGRSFKYSPYADIESVDDLKPKPYETKLQRVISPFSEYRDLNSLLKDFEESSSYKSASFILAKMTPELKNDRIAMMDLVKKIPEAIWHVGHDLKRDDYFISKAIMQNPRVYDVLSEKQQKDPAMIQAYTRGKVWNCSYLERADGQWVNRNPQPDAQIAVFSNAINENCDKNIFFSPETYRGFYEAVLMGELNSPARKGDPRDFDEFSRYAKELAYLYAARAYSADKPDLDLKLHTMEAEVILDKKDYILTKIEQDPRSEYAKMMAEAVAFASLTMTANRNVTGLSEINELMHNIENAENVHNNKVREDIRNALDRLSSGVKVTDRFANYYQPKELTDRLVEEAEKHPEIGITKEEIEKWWEIRGNDLKDLEDRISAGDKFASRGDLKYLQEMTKYHPEMIEEESKTIEIERQ